jgi:toxin ParE1/3/4
MRSVKLRYAPRARSDIAQIYEYIARHDTRAATAVVRQIRSASGLLAQYPGLGQETDIPGVRVLPTVRYPYLIYHRVRDSELIIIHVRDGRRDAPKESEL